MNGPRKEGRCEAEAADMSSGSSPGTGKTPPDTPEPPVRLNSAQFRSCRAYCFLATPVSCYCIILYARRKFVRFILLSTALAFPTCNHKLLSSAVFKNVLEYLLPDKVLRVKCSCLHFRVSVNLVLIK